MKNVTIDKNNVHLVDNFIKNIGNSAGTFRYYSKRKPQEAIDNHIITLLLFDESYVGYGHLDKEDETVWLGICVKEGATGKGYGKKIMQKLVNSYDGEITLSVDSSNKKAINLYKSFSFLETKKSPDIVYMKRAYNKNS